MHASGILLRPWRAYGERLLLSLLAPAATGRTWIVHYFI
jgi:hypothetical protein